MSEMCCTRFAENTGHKKSPFWPDKFVGLYLHNWGMYRRLEKNF